MKTNTTVITAITTLLILLMAGSAMCATYNDQIILVEKENFVPGGYNIVTDGATATVDFNNSGDEFEWHAYGTVPNFDINQGCFCYALIYYADEDERFDDWGGANPGACIGTFEVNVCDGSFDTEDTAIDLGINMPEYPDFNGNPDPSDEYCNAEGDGYENCCGAKLWIVPCSDYDAPSMTAWNPADYLFETDLIWYDDTDYHIEPNVMETIVNVSCVSAGDTVLVGATVRDGDGVYDLENMVVTANMSVYGVDEIVVLDYVEMDGCIDAYYNATVQVTKKTIDYCYERNGYQTEFVIVAEDPSGANDTLEESLDVEPGTCAYMQLHNMECDGSDAYDEELRTVALTQLANCNTRDYTNWWGHGDMFDIYMIRYSVQMYDEYNNHIGSIDDHCRDGFTAWTTGTDVSLKIGTWSDDKIIMVNENNPGETTLTVRCLENDGIDDVVQVIEFLNPIADLDVISDIDVLYTTDDEINITAQIVDLYGDPIMMPRVEVVLLTDNSYTTTGETDENGVVTFDIEIPVSEAGASVEFTALAECKAGAMTLNVVEPVINYVVIGDTESPVEFGENQTLTCTCYTDHDTMMCCDNETWSCNEYGEIDATTGYFVAGDVEGVAVVEVNVSGITNTTDIVINGIDCDGHAAMAQPGVEGNLTSGTVMVSWNFTGNGTVCVQALGDPIPEWGNDTKGAFVFVETSDPGGDENVTLDLNGTGDTWMLNNSTWEFYAAGDTSTVGLGIYQMFALIYDEPEPEPEYGGCNVSMSLKKDGIELDNQTVLFNGTNMGDSVYTYAINVAGVDNVPVFSCIVSNVSVGTDSTIVQVRYVFLVDDTFSQNNNCTSAIYNEYCLYANEGLMVAGNDGYYFKECMSSRYVFVNNTANESSALLVEFHDGDVKTLAIGETWDLGRGFTLTVQSTDCYVEPDPDPDPTPTATPRRRSSSSSGGSGLYAPEPTNTTVADNTTSTPPPEPADDDAVTSETPVSNDDKGKDDDKKPTPTPVDDSPGFAAVFAIAGILAVAYIVRQKRE